LATTRAIKVFPVPGSKKRVDKQKPTTKITNSVQRSNEQKQSKQNKQTNIAFSHALPHAWWSIEQYPARRLQAKMFKHVRMAQRQLDNLTHECHLLLQSANRIVAEARVLPVRLQSSIRRENKNMNTNTITQNSYNKQTNKQIKNKNNTVFHTLATFTFGLLASSAFETSITVAYVT
jgi:hypothetical protein